ncbi:hypothetical protein Pint_05334 [Pistacia integerrima]|uniref:Uncharacterized protein n=1 Tax=Pistacia integerrima TaxID=434235 RepID=A0ACC0YZU6_9ROSI|nr:hypothetical protein Pint_05334 [Pistacia integerrima]
MNNLFKDFVQDPLATASIAQVHRAKLMNGQQVVVKVRHQGIKKIMLEDLKDAKSIVEWIAWAEPLYDFNSMIDEWCKETSKELDFNHEAENTRIVSRHLCCKNRCEDNNTANKVDVLIPESTEAVLILEYMDGIRLNDSESLEGNFLVSKEAPHRPILLDFGLTKKLSNSVKQALAKMLLAAAEGDHVALLSAMAEMGLKLRLDLPEEAMEVTTLFFRDSTAADEAQETMKNITDLKTKNMKVIQEKMNLDQKEVKRFNPIDAFPGDIVIFSKVLRLLRGLSSTMNVRIAYMDIMRPFAESVLEGNINMGPAVNPQWIYDTPVPSDVEAKLREFLIELGNDGKILGIQVCAYKDGEVIIDMAAGVLGRYDPRPVQPDSLFNVFSVTKGITAGLLHWLVDNGYVTVLMDCGILSGRKLKLEENVAKIWRGFGSNGTNWKDLIKVHHVLNHTSGLHNALMEFAAENPFLLADWNECLSRIAMSVPETEPGQQQFYHYLSFGWLCGGIIEHASGKRFQEILEEAFIRPLNIEGELYVGIPPAIINGIIVPFNGYPAGVEFRLATLTLDIDEFNTLSESHHPDLPSTMQPEQFIQLAKTFPPLFNMLNLRRGIMPATNGHCSAHCTLLCSPPQHSSLSKPTLGSHTHMLKFSSQEKSNKPKHKKSKEVPAASKYKTNNNGSHSQDASGDGYTRLTNTGGKIFSNPRIHDAFLGVGDYGNLVLPNGQFGLGFKRHTAKDGSFIRFGHSGMGGSTGFCDIKHRFVIVVTLNKLSFGAMTARIIDFVCSELNIPVPVEFLPVRDLVKPLVN